jgi:hypothetical protein
VRALAAGRRATHVMSGSIGARVMDDIAMEDILLMVVALGSMFLVGPVAKRRGRSSDNWMSIAMLLLGPFALLLLLLLPDLSEQSGDLTASAPFPPSQTMPPPKSD